MTSLGEIYDSLRLSTQVQTASQISKNNGNVAVDDLLPFHGGNADGRGDRRAKIRELVDEVM